MMNLTWKVIKLVNIIIISSENSETILVFTEKPMIIDKYESIFAKNEKMIYSETSKLFW
jgi:hypothetical protein